MNLVDQLMEDIEKEEKRGKSYEKIKFLNL